MSDYVRPTLPHQVFYDSDGAVINYGNRWWGVSAPKDSYSVVSHPERFAPLYLVAGALIDHLARSFEVEVSEDLAFADDLLADFKDVQRAVRVVPMKEDEAPLTIVFTGFPGVAIHAGMLVDFAFPFCGCDGCDDSLERMADQLEETVLAVTRGDFSEQIDGYVLSRVDGTWRSKRGRQPGVPLSRLEIAGERFRRLPRGWQAWSPRN